MESTTTEENEVQESEAERIKRVLSLTDNEKNEMVYRRLSSLSFIIIVLVFGIPLWWQTTSTHRVPFRSFPPEQKVIIPVFVKIISKNPLLDLSKNFISLIQDGLSEKADIDMLKLKFNIRFDQTSIFDDKGDDSDNDDDDKRFIMRLIIVNESEWHFPGQSMHFSAHSIAYILYCDDILKLSKRILSAIDNVLLDVDHLTNIIRRDEQHKRVDRRQQIAPVNLQQKQVWNTVALKAEYIVQLIFAHISTGLTCNCYSGANLVLNARRFAAKLDGITELKISSEHLWDFDLPVEVNKENQDSWTVDISDVPSIVTAVDQSTSTVESSATVLKLVVIDAKHPLMFLNEDGTGSTGVVVASWGALLSFNGFKNYAVNQSMVTAMRILFGLDSHQFAISREKVPLAKWEINRLRLHTFAESAISGILSVQALQKLIAQIDNIVINEDVAKEANRAVDLISKSLSISRQSGVIDVGMAVQGCVTAERALNDQSLLALLYFPNDQKFAVYLPLFLPTLLPLFGSIIALYKQYRDSE